VNNQSEATVKSDIYSYSIVLWELIFEDEPFNGDEKNDEFSSLAMFKSYVIEQNGRPKIPVELDKNIDFPKGRRKEILSLMVSGWDHDPEKRPKAVEIVESFLKMSDDFISFGDKNTIQFSTSIEGEDVLTFLNQFSNYISTEIPKTDELILEKLLCETKSNEKYVTKDRFTMFLDWFGPFQDAKQGYKNMMDVCKEPWFHGPISREDAENLLNGSKNKVFLIRSSTKLTDFIPFVISVVKNKKVSHMQIKKKGTKLFVLTDSNTNIEGKNVKDIVKSLKKDKLIGEPLDNTPNPYIYLS